MAGLKVIWSFKAKIQRNEILKYWNKRNKSTRFSKKLTLKIKQQTNQLKLQPNLGKKIVGTDKRILIFGNYSLIYFSNSEQIQILLFWENHQDPEKLLQFLSSQK